MSHKRKLLIVEIRDARPGGFTTPLYWSCECEEGYIHPATQADCLACGVLQDEAPDARVDEVLRQARSLGLERQTVIEFLRELSLEADPLPYAPPPPRPGEDAWLEAAHEDQFDPGDW